MIDGTSSVGFSAAAVVVVVLLSLEAVVEVVEPVSEVFAVVFVAADDVVDVVTFLATVVVFFSEDALTDTVNVVIIESATISPIAFLYISFIR